MENETKEHKSHRPHIEVHRSIRSDGLIQISCFCKIGRFHTYNEWADLSERSGERAENSYELLRIS